MTKAKPQDMPFVEVAVALPAEHTFDYQVPRNLSPVAEIGKRVLVPFGKRRVTGYIIREKTSSDREDVKDILQILDDLPLFGPSMVPFYQWVSNYYHYPLGKVIKGALPAGITVEDCRIVRFNPRKRDDVRFRKDPTMRGELFKYLQQEGEVSLTHLRRHFKGQGFYAGLSSLEKEGWVDFDVSLKGQMARPRVETFVTYNGDSGKDVPRGESDPTEYMLLQRLRDMGEFPLRSLKKEIAGASRILKRLERKGTVSLVKKEVYRDPFTDDIFQGGSKPILSSEQTSALEAIEKALKSRGFVPFLLHGVTASGKTEIYLTAVGKTLSQGRPAIVLVPEIALTPQLEYAFRSRFGDRIAVLHSKLSLGMRYDQWIRIRKREVDVVIGTRSAIFAPFDQPGLIIVDEEHDTSYKQEKRLRYNARDLAVLRAKMSKAVLILGSATPSIQSYYNAVSSKFGYLPLLDRVGGGALPKVTVIDMRTKRDKNGGMLSQELTDAIGQNLERKEQTLLFLNRRGFAGFMLCADCGYAFRCLNCNVGLTFHSTESLLRCHYCGFNLRSPTICRECQGTNILYLGLGTERVEEEIKQLYPLARVARMDRDVMLGRKSHIGILKGLQDSTIDILIGTQMITKGHHFPNVTLVGVILADLSLHIPDFRASERTFQLLAQVAGRAGRGKRPGEVIIQTYNPDHYSIRAAMHHDFLKFYECEIAQRSELSYPPFSRLVNLKISGNRLESVVEYAHRLGEVCRFLQQRVGDAKRSIHVLGPVAAPLSKIKGKYRWQLLIKGEQVKILHTFCKRIFEEAKRIRMRGVQLTVDVDPMNML